MNIIILVSYLYVVMSQSLNLTDKNFYKETNIGKNIPTASWMIMFCDKCSEVQIQNLNNFSLQNLKLGFVELARNPLLSQYFKQDSIGIFMIDNKFTLLSNITMKPIDELYLEAIKLEFKRIQLFSLYRDLDFLSFEMWSVHLGLVILGWFLYKQFYEFFSPQQTKSSSSRLRQI